MPPAARLITATLVAALGTPVPAATPGPGSGLVANSAIYLALPVPSPTGARRWFPREIGLTFMQIPAPLDFNLTDAGVMASLTADRRRPILLSLGIADPAAFPKVLIDLEARVRSAPFSVRYALVIPVADLAVAAAVLESMATRPECGHPRGDAARWAAWLARVKDPSERKAAADAAYVCLPLEGGAVVARLDRARRALVWVYATASEGAIAAAAAPLEPAPPALARRLERLGFFQGPAAYSRPSDVALTVATLKALSYARTFSRGVLDEEARQWWGMAKPVAALRRALESPPVLFSDVVYTDRGLSWALTKKGVAFFSSLKLPRPVSVQGLLERVQSNNLPLQGIYDIADYQSPNYQLVRGELVEPLPTLFLWPHNHVFAQTHHTGPGSVGPPFLEEGTFELDRKNARLVLRGP